MDKVTKLGAVVHLVSLLNIMWSWTFKKVKDVFGPTKASITITLIIYASPLSLSLSLSLPFIVHMQNLYKLFYGSCSRVPQRKVIRLSKQVQEICEATYYLWQDR